MIDTTQKNVHFKNKINGNITRSGAIDKETINPHDLCYWCSKYVPEFLFGKFRIIDSRNEPYFPAKRG